MVVWISSLDWLGCDKISSWVWLGAPEALVADGDDLAVREFVGLLQGGGGSGLAHLSLEVKSNIAELLLDITDDFTLCGGGEGVATLSHDLHKVSGKIATSQVQTEDGVGQGVTFVDGDGVGDTITSVQDDTGGTARGIERQDSLDGDVHGGGAEGFEHDLGHLLTVSLGVKRGLSKEDWGFFRSNTELVVEGVMPDLLHIIPVGDDTVFDGVFESEDTSLALGFITDVGVFLAHTDHDTLMTGAAYDGGEDSPGGVISGETGFDHTGAIVADKSGSFVVTHGWMCWLDVDE